jgi:hypothetical protein
LILLPYLTGDGGTRVKIETTTPTDLANVGLQTLKLSFQPDELQKRKAEHEEDVPDEIEIRRRLFVSQ